jgi:hypothetical protein
MVEVKCFSETSVDLQRASRRYVPELEQDLSIDRIHQTTTKCGPISEVTWYEN